MENHDSHAVVAERIRTDRRLPDGDGIDVWIMRRGGADGPPVAASDLGETLRWRRDAGLPPLPAAQIAACVAPYGVDVQRGMLRTATDAAGCADAVARVAAAAAALATAGTADAAAMPPSAA